jgi:hypothetical protein
MIIKGYVRLVVNDKNGCIPTSDTNLGKYWQVNKSDIHE